MSDAPAPAAVLDWRVRIDEIGDTARDVTYRAPATAYAPLAAAIGVDQVRACEAHLHLVVRGEQMIVSGAVRAQVVQTCGVSLQPFDATIDEPIDVRFAPSDDRPAQPLSEGEEGSPGMVERPEPLVNGSANLGALVQEFLALGVDPYPRKPGAAFEAPAEDSGRLSPFATLSRLRPGPADDA